MTLAHAKAVSDIRFWVNERIIRDIGRASDLTLNGRRRERIVESSQRYLKDLRACISRLGDPEPLLGAFHVAENQYPEVAAFERVLEVAEALPVPERKSPRSMLEDVIVQLNGALATAKEALATLPPPST